MSDKCLCGHWVDSHIDGWDDWTACAECGCVGYQPARDALEKP